MISWEEQSKDKDPAGGSGPHRRGRVSLCLHVSGLRRLNLLDALSPIIAERARGRGADVTWSAGLAGKIMWDNCWIALAPGNQRGGGRDRGGLGDGGGGRLEDSAGTEGGVEFAAAGGGVSTAVGGDSRQRELL